MDFKKFGLIVALIGVLILGYGGVRFAMNQPVGQSGGGLGSFFDARASNMERGQARSEAMKVGGAGALVLILGLGVRFAAKKDKTE